MARITIRRGISEELLHECFYFSMRNKPHENKNVQLSHLQTFASLTIVQDFSSGSRSSETAYPYLSQYSYSIPYLSHPSVQKRQIHKLQA
jgi:hypothetical protein